MKKDKSMVQLKSTSEDLKMMITIAEQKRKQSYYEIKKWDAKRSERMSIHRNLIDEISSKCLQIINKSNQQIQVYCKWFQDRVAMQSLKAKPLSNLQSFEFFEHILKIQKRQQDLISIQLQSITTNILKRLQKAKDYYKKILTIIQNLSNYKELFVQKMSQLQKIGQVLAQLFAKGQNTYNPLSNEQDLMLVQLQYLKITQDQTQLQRLIGLQCLQIYKQSVFLERFRAQQISSAINIYLKQYQPDCPLISLDVNEGIKNIFDLNKLVDSRTLNLIMLESKNEESAFSVHLLEQYINSYLFQQFPIKNMCLKQFPNIVCSNVAQSNIQIPINIVLSVNGYLHCLSTQSKYSFPLMSLKINNTFMLRSISQIGVVIKKMQQKKKGVFGMFQIDAYPSTLLKFKSKDVKEQFCMFLKKMI